MEHDSPIEHRGEARPVAYIRAVKSSEVKAQTPLPPDAVLYAVHDGEGRPLALFADRETAIAAARTHDYEPVSVH